MTIKGMAIFLKKRMPFYRRSVPVEWFRGKRIAVDTYLLAYAYMSTAIASEAKKLVHARKMEIDQSALTTRWLSRFISTMTLMIEAGMKPVLVLDGESPPEKKETRAKRQGIKSDVREQIAILKDRLQSEDLETDIATREQICKLMARDIKVTKYHMDRLTELMESMGIPIIQAKGEGEALCATLVKEGKCHAVFTKDSDAGAYLAPIVILEIENATYDSTGRRYQCCEVIYYKQVFKALNLTPEQFVDLCIMSGSDYGDNVPGKGTGKCYPLLLKYGSIENIPLDKLDTPQLNYQRIRQLFSARAEITTGDVEDGIVAPDLAQKLASAGLLKSGSRLLQLLSSQYSLKLNQDLANMSLGDAEVGQIELDPAELL